MGNTSIVVCGTKFDIGTRVILWDEPEGLNGYDTSRRVTKIQDRKTGKITNSVVEGKRYGSRVWIGTPSLTKLQNIVTQFFLHHSGMYRAKDTFGVLHNERRLSVHFILGDDGVIYQTLDLMEKAWHGGSNNPMSVGIEIDSRAHASKYPDAYDEAHCKKYGVGPRKKRIDYVQKSWMMGYEYNDKQYEALIWLGVGLKTVFPKMGEMKFPTDQNNRIIKYAISASAAQKHCGLMCHYNNSSSKNDPISLDHYRLMHGIKTNDPLFSSTFLVADTWKDRQEWLQVLGFNVSYSSVIKEFQKYAGLSADGIWGIKTGYMMDLILKERKLR